MQAMTIESSDTTFMIRSASLEEADLFYAMQPEEDARLGTIGHIRFDFGKSGDEFWHTWWPRGPEILNSTAFKSELQVVVDQLRENVLKDRSSMEFYCIHSGGRIPGGWVQNYGYIIETEHYRYCLRCNPSPGDYSAYLTAFDLDVRRLNMALEEKALIGRVTFVNGDTQEFTIAEDFLECIRKELPDHPVTGFRYKVLTDDLVVRKAVDDTLYDLYGEENPHTLDDYETKPEQDMTMGGMA